MIFQHTDLFIFPENFFKKQYMSFARPQTPEKAILELFTTEKLFHDVMIRQR